MTVRARIIPKLEIKGPNVVKGLQFEGNRVLGLAEKLAEQYYLDGADELIYQDVVASVYRRNGLFDFIRRTARKLFIPLTVGGGIRTIEDIDAALRSGADKVCINTAAVENPNFITEASRIFGSQCIVASIEYFTTGDSRRVWTDFGREVTSLDAAEWAVRAVELGAGEILLTSIDRDGLGKGLDVDFIAKVSAAVPVPVIACGGARTGGDVQDAFVRGHADAVAAASIFHYSYAEPVDAPTMTFNERRLRMGEQIDSGNIDFLRSGYGGERAIFVEPISIPALKAMLSEAGVVTRKVDTNSLSSSKLFEATEQSI